MEKILLLMLATSLLLLLITAGLLCLSLVLNHREREKWMRMFSLQQGIPLPSTATEPKTQIRIPLKPKNRFSIPIPGGEMFKRPQ